MLGKSSFLVILALVSCAAAATTGFSAEKSFGLISYTNRAHLDVENNDTVELECGTMKNADSFRFYRDALELKTSVPRPVTVHRTGNSLCFTTNSTVPCVIHSIFA
ncbi:hypothetical protein DFJ77DRAFT_442384 [Powellomyces hirtus]|nr:hypothetical protein DFJ77DRAFT_442384 [Powellomyces hirtus]